MDPRVTSLYNEYIHGDMSRRDFLKRVARRVKVFSRPTTDLVH